MLTLPHRSCTVATAALNRYAPLSARLVQASVRPGWVQAAEALKLLPGPCVEVEQDAESLLEDLPATRKHL